MIITWQKYCTAWISSLFTFWSFFPQSRIQEAKKYRINGSWIRICSTVINTVNHVFFVILWFYYTCFMRVYHNFFNTLGGSTVLKWIRIRIRSNDTDPTGSGSETRFRGCALCFHICLMLYLVVSCVSCVSFVINRNMY